MNPVQIALLLLAILVALPLAALLLKVLLGFLGALGAILLGLLPLVLLVAALVSCILSAKPSNTKLLWILLIIFAPFLGPLLWFFWGKSNT